MKLIKKLFKTLFYTIVAAVICLNLFVLLSGRFYLYKGVWNTYLKGKTGPSIYDKDIFYSSTIEKSDSVYNIPISSQYNKAKIPNDFRQYIEDLQTTSYLVFKNDSLIYEEYWDGHEESTVSNSFSMAKSIVGMLTVLAVDEGYIKSLDDPVANYLPAFKEKGREVVTIRNLLTMSSGLSWTESGKDPLSDNAESYYGNHLREQVIRQTLIGKPGEMFRYQSGNTQLLAFILEAATGKKVTKYAEEKIWKKIGAESDAFWSLDNKDGDEKAFCCIYATARDYGRLGLMFEHKGDFNGKEILPRWVYEVLITPEPMNTEQDIPNTRYGLQVWTYFGNAHPTYYFRGVNGQYVITVPDEDLVIVRTGNKRFSKFVIPEHLKDDEAYVKANLPNVGHTPDFFQYIALGKSIVAQVESN